MKDCSFYSFLLEREEGRLRQTCRPSVVSSDEVASVCRSFVGCGWFSILQLSSNSVLQLPWSLQDKGDTATVSLLIAFNLEASVSIFVLEHLDPYHLSEQKRESFSGQNRVVSILLN